MTSEHQFHGFADHPGGYYDDATGNCTVCNGGLAWCKVCGAAEGELTTECPGEKVPADKREAVFAGRLDFKDGAWQTK